jgi:hypothetical protein
MTCLPYCISNAISPILVPDGVAMVVGSKPDWALVPRRRCRTSAMSAFDRLCFAGLQLCATDVGRMTWMAVTPGPLSATATLTWEFSIFSTQGDKLGHKHARDHVYQDAYSLLGNADKLTTLDITLLGKGGILSCYFLLTCNRSNCGN